MESAKRLMLQDIMDTFVIVMDAVMSSNVVTMMTETETVTELDMAQTIATNNTPSIRPARSTSMS